MSSSYPPPFQPRMSAPEAPSRPLVARVAAWSAVGIGALLSVSGLFTLELGALLVGLLMIAAGLAYLRMSPSRGRRRWAVPALLILPALAFVGLTAPEESPAVVPVAAVPELPSVAPVTTTSAAPTTSPAATTASPSIAPTTESVAAVVETPQYVPVPDPEPERQYVPQPVYTPEPAYTAPAPLAAIPEAPANVVYANCDAVRAAGAAPIYAGQAGYSSKLDRDNDGVGCEN